MSRSWGLVVGLVMVLAGSGCRSQAAVEHAPGVAVKVDEDVWAQIGGQRIFFGHQSVGENILQGIRDLQRDSASRPVRIVDMAAGSVPEGPVLLHRHVGTNGDPVSKIRGFAETLDSGSGRDVDVAAMKFCFWDIRSDTDVRAVFAEYERTLAALQARHPRTRFVHLTVPLYTADTDWRASLRRMIGRPVPRTEDNAKRDALSQLIRTRYLGREPVFDLATLEAASETEHGVPYLAVELTSDGGHLNADGRRKVASGFLQAMAAAAREPQPGTR
jgi:hypothetical protein